MTALDYYLLWDQVTNHLDSARDCGHYELANSIENYLDMLGEEIESFFRMH